MAGGDEKRLIKPLVPEREKVNVSEPREDEPTTCVPCADESTTTDFNLKGEEDVQAGWLNNRPILTCTGCIANAQSQTSEYPASGIKGCQ
jgi:hypothetical protein